MYHHLVYLSVYYVQLCVRLSPRGLTERSVGPGVYAGVYSIGSSQVTVTLRENRVILL